MTRRRVIPQKHVAPVASLIFNKAKFSGGALAREMTVEHNTLWNWFVKRGPTPEVADRVAEVMEDWAQELMHSARYLRRLSHRAKLGEFDEVLEESVAEPDRDPRSLVDDHLPAVNTSGGANGGGN